MECVLSWVSCAWINLWDVRSCLGYIEGGGDNGSP